MIDEMGGYRDRLSMGINRPSRRSRTRPRNTKPLKFILQQDQHETTYDPNQITVHLPNAVRRKPKTERRMPNTESLAPKTLYLKP